MSNKSLMSIPTPKENNIMNEMTRGTRHWSLFEVLGRSNDSKDVEDMNKK